MRWAVIALAVAIVVAALILAWAITEPTEVNHHRDKKHCAVWEDCRKPPNSFGF